MAYNSSKNRHIGSYTNLPVSEVAKAGYSASSLIVQTPHKGEVIIEIKKIHHPMFGGDTETEKTTQEIISELLLLQREARDYLFENWINTLPTN